MLFVLEFGKLYWNSRKVKELHGTCSVKLIWKKIIRAVIMYFWLSGALYPDKTSNALKEDDSVPPGGSYTYRWVVQPRFAPTNDDANCLTWVYHSHIDTPKDVASGLIGPLITCKKGTIKYCLITCIFCTESLYPEFYCVSNKADNRWLL